jgi:predicted nucleic acid-binding protein
MKGLDTPVLEGLLRGDPAVRGFLRHHEGEELCTTAVNLFELEVAAHADPSAGKERRAAALDRLRRKMTIVEVGPAAARAAAVHLLGSKGRSLRPSEALMLGAFESAGCAEVVTTRESRLISGTRALRVVVLGENESKARSKRNLRSKSV